jgi:YkoY family integral membrane protein
MKTPAEELFRVVGLQSADFLPIAGTILTLVVLEGLLSCDNALVLAVMVRHLPKQLQKRALRYGIWGAFVFRLIAILFAVTLLAYWQLKVLGGLYLLYLAISRLVYGEPEEGSATKSRFGTGFWATVVGVELADIAFSIDSILAAVAMAEGLPDRFDQMKIGFLSVTLWIVYIGGVLGIVTMRYVAGLFLILLRRFSGLATGAYVLVAWIGLELMGSGFHTALHPVRPANLGGPPPAPREWHSHVPQWLFDIRLQMPEWLFWTGMIVIFAASMFYRPPGSRDADSLARVVRAEQGGDSISPDSISRPPEKTS